MEKSASDSKHPNIFEILGYTNTHTSNKPSTGQLPAKDSEEPSGALALGATGYLLIVPTWQWKITKMWI